MITDRSQPGGGVVTNGNYYSIADITAFNLPGFPRSKKGWYSFVERNAWLYRDVEGGGGRGGIRREYMPPPKVQALIEARQRGELPAAAPVRQPASKRAAPVEVTEDDYVDLIPPKIGGAVVKCPGCGTFVGLIKIDGRVQLEFDSPGAITLMQVMASLQPAFNGEAEALYDLSLRAYAVLSLLTAGSETSISNLLSKPDIVKTLAAFCEALNATPPHNHTSKPA